MANAPAISPDGRWVAYVGWPQATVYVRPIDARASRVGPRRVVVRLPAAADRADLDSAFSSDGRSVAMLGSGGFRAAAPDELAWTVHLDGTNLQQLPMPSSLFGGGPAWSARGRLAFGAQGYIYLLDADGSDIAPIPGQGYDNHDPVWSPDGRQVLFLRGGLELMAADADGQRLRRLHRWDGYRDAIAISPDGRHLALVVRGEINAHLEITRRDGLRPRALGLPRGAAGDTLTWTTS